MNPKLIFIPLFAQVLLTAIVQVRMYISRAAEMKSKRIHPQEISTTASTTTYLTDSARLSDNFSNQFEMPILFYVLLIALYITDSVTMLLTTMAGIFVASRYVHSYIHCGYNRVMHRFYAYLTGSIVLWIMWLLFAVALISAE